MKTTIFFLLFVTNFITIKSMELSPERKQLFKILSVADKEIKKIEETLKLDRQDNNQKKINEPYIINAYFMHYGEASPLQKNDINTITKHK